MRVRVADVFVPGGLPQHTYVSRGEGALEQRLRIATDNVAKLVTITGPTKSGKTVLARRVLSSRSVVWIDGGAIGTEAEFWSEVGTQLEVAHEIALETASEVETTVEVEAEGQIRLPLVASGAARARAGLSGRAGRTTTRTRSLSHKSAAIKALREESPALVVDDFHYLEREVQGAIVRALKALIFDGLTVVLIAIPHRRYDAIRVEREMTARVEQITIVPWNHEELLEIPRKGFGLLNTTVEPGVLAKLANEALGSPHLMQDFCRKICLDEGLEEAAEARREITDFSPASIFRQVAAGMNKVAFDRLARGPSSKTDRKERLLKDGRRVDIYEAVLAAIARLDPGIRSLDYEEIRASLRSLLEETPPRAHEVSRVLDHMSKISATDDSSAAVIDWDKDGRRLFITDPFFAFFLKWGLGETKE